MDRHQPTHRKGFMPRGVGVALCATLLMALAGWSLLPHQREIQRDKQPLTWPVARAVFVHEIHRRGEVESLENVAVKCEVRAMGFKTAEILELPFPEGTFVKQGDVLVKLDAAPLEKLKIEQQILFNSREAALAQAQSQLEVSLTERAEYINGLFPNMQKTLVIQVDASTEALRMARRFREYGKSMYRQGFATQLGLDANEIRVEKAQIDLDKDENALRVEELFKMPKALKAFDAAIANARASVKSSSATVKLNRIKLADIDEQIAKCVIKAPLDGQLIYSHIQHDSRSYMIEEGAPVWENRVIFSLPNSDQMQVAVMILEEHLRIVKPGMPAVISLDAMPGVILHGQVEKIAKTAKPDSWLGPDKKQYETTISIDASSLQGHTNQLRPGLTADITIQIENDPTTKEVLLPKQATFEHKEKTYCIVVDDLGQWQAVALKTGRSNKVFVVIDQSQIPLEGRTVILAAPNYRNQVDLPEVEEEAGYVSNVPVLR